MRVGPLLVVAAFGCGRVGFDARGGDDTSAHDAASMPGDGDATGDGARPGDGDVGGAVFTNLAPTSPPAARRSSGAAVQAVAGTDRIWIFGGFGSAGFRNDLHVYDAATNAWAPLTGTGTPSARERHALAWDPAGNQLVMFGGQFAMVVNFTHYDDLFVFRPATNAWVQIPKAGAWPAPRKDAAFLYIPHLGKLLLYGGNDGTGAGSRFSDLWLLTLDLAGTSSWTQLAPGGVAPPAQSAGCVVYDPAARRVLLFGGEVQDGNAATTTYQYLVDDNVWQQDTTTGTPPPGASFNQCAWDPSLGRIVLYGGQATNGAPLAGTYVYDPTTKVWSTVATAPGSPSPGDRADGAAVYSPARSGLVWFGGRTALSTYTNETWLLDIR